MKTVKPGDFIFWKGELAAVVATIDRPAALIQIIGECKCENCGHATPHHQFASIMSSPQFQESATPVPTMKEVDPLI
jgi:hypothetical protein